MSGDHDMRGAGRRPGTTGNEPDGLTLQSPGERPQLREPLGGPTEPSRHHRPDCVPSDDGPSLGFQSERQGGVAAGWRYARLVKVGEVHVAQTGDRKVLAVLHRCRSPLSQVSPRRALRARSGTLTGILRELQARGAL